MSSVKPGLGSKIDKIAAKSASERKTRTLWGDALRRLSRNYLAMGALAWILIVIIATVSADLWVPQNFGDPTLIDTQTAAQTRLQPPSSEHPFGTDDMGRDLFGRVIYGARVSLTVGIVATAVAFSVGILIGAMAGFLGKWVDALLMRMTDIILSFPYVLMVVLVMSVLPQEVRGAWSVTAAIAAFSWGAFARLFRSSVLSVKENDYVLAARALGASTGRIIFRHILPNAIAPALVIATMTIGGIILTESALSFLGLGIQAPEISWGRMIDDGRRFLTHQPQLVLYPGLAILSTVLSFMLLGDGVRDALDTKSKD
ncbi:MAG: ABC transporter permease [Coriobacteriia bacterium]|nr:ABC transporter permease [Coriobacteriia bacterium]MCL2745738.1 ABC transporter permease [Coriobacteriia bacterium]MCL2870867.1 ABC transporter permease [Coriobacteriia bacterium]